MKEQFTDAEKARVEQAISLAEKECSGEIRVHVEKKCKEDVLDHAAFIFEKLEMHKTELRNGVLIYVSIDDHKFAIIGDAGINAKVPKGFWEDIREHMLVHFKKGQFVQGLEEGIAMAGEQLKAHFPFKRGDENELSNKISWGKSEK